MIKNIKTSITGTTSTAITSVAAGSVGVIFSIAICNTGTVSTNITLNLGASHTLISAVPLPAGETFIYSTKLVVNASEVLNVLSSTATPLFATVSMDELAQA